MKRIGGFVAALLGMGIVGIMVAVPAFAHHPIVTGEVVCSTDGNTVVITWHLQNSETVTGTNRSMHVVTATLDHGTLSGISAGTTVTPQPTAGSTVAGHTTLASTTTGTVTLTVDVNFDLPGPQGVVGSATVTLPLSCPHPTTTTAPTTTVPATTTTTHPASTTTVPATTTTKPVTITVPSTTTVLATTTTTKAPVAAVTTTTTTPTAALATTGGPALGEAAAALLLVVAGLTVITAATVRRYRN